jgi:MinD superfamily P-loop ATPase
MTIAVANGKGGVGEAMLATSLATTHAREYSALLHDLKVEVLDTPHSLCARRRTTYQASHTYRRLSCLDSMVQDRPDKVR